MKSQDEKAPANDAEKIKEIDDLLSGYKENASVSDEDEQPKKSGRGRKPGSKNKATLEKENERPRGDSIEIGDYLSGQVMLLFIDIVIPGTITLAHNKLSKKKIKLSALQLSAKQKSDLEPLADEAVKELMLKLNPLTTFAICLLTIYFSNLVLLHNS